MHSAGARTLREDDHDRSRPAPRRLQLVEPAEGRPDRRSAPPRSAGGARRTVRITGQAAPPRRRSRTSAEVAARPDRVALWAFLLGLFLIFVAAATADAAPL